MLAIVFLGLCSTLLLGLFQVSLAIREKIRLQISADLAVLSLLNCQANGLNSIAVANRAILANDALAGQLNAMVSETSFYRELVDKFRRLLRFIPYAGPFSQLASIAARSMERIVKSLASWTLPLARYANGVLRNTQVTIRSAIPFHSLQAARSSLKENMPHARITALSEGLILKQARSLKKNLVDLPLDQADSLRLGTMDRHTLKRDWRIRAGGFTAVKKTGGTTLSPADLGAEDELRMKVLSGLRWRWKTVLHTRSQTSEMGYVPPETLVTLKKDNLPSSLSLTVLLRSEMPAPLGKGAERSRKLLALAAGRLVYRRESRPDEVENAFNPFWKTELIPVATEPLSKKLVPQTVLKGVRH